MIFDETKFNAIAEKYREPVRAYRFNVQRAAARVEIARAMVEELEQQRYGLAGIITKRAAAERDALTNAIHNWKGEVKKREIELAEAKAGGKERAASVVEHITNKII